MRSLTQFVQLLSRIVSQTNAEASDDAASPKSTPAPGKKRTVAGGIGVEDLKIGHGPEAKPGKTVSVALWRVWSQRLELTCCQERERGMSSNILFFFFCIASNFNMRESGVWQQSFSFLLYSVHLQHYDNSDRLSLVQTGLF